MNEDIMRFLNIKQWHDKGIKGQGIRVASIETGNTAHSLKTLDVLRQILPEAEILTNIKYWHDDLPQLDGYTCSQERANSDDIDRVKKQKELSCKNVFMTCSIGNEADDSFNPLAKYEEWISVGACKLKDGLVKPEYYSSNSEYIDFVELTDWQTQYGRFTGTSCANPVLQGMAMLVKCLYKLKFNRVLSNAELYEFIRKNCVDVGGEGFDNKCGHGLFILPDMENLMDIVLKIGDKKALVNGEYVTLDVPPKIEKGRTLVPLRFIAENLGCNVEWDSLEQKIYINNLNQ